MNGFNHLPNSTRADVQTFIGGWDGQSVAAGKVWSKPSGVTMCHIICLGGGGGGGNGAVAGAASTSGGGGGGASGSQTAVIVPAWLLPDKLYVYAGYGGAANSSGLPSYVGLQYLDTTNVNQIVAYALGGGGGGGSAGSAGGPGGTAGGTPAAASMLYTFKGCAPVVLNGNVGIIGGTSVTAVDKPIPTTGLVVTGGAGGGGLPASGNGTNGANVVGTTAVTLPLDGRVPSNSNYYAFGGLGSAGNGGNGSDGTNYVNGILQFTGGAGGASTAVGGAYVAGNGGNGGYGCGGGGGGGCFTGGTRSLGGRGGDGIVIITSW